MLLVVYDAAREVFSGRSELLSEFAFTMRFADCASFPSLPDRTATIKLQ